MARTWRELFITDDDLPAESADDDEPEQKRGFFRRLRENMSKSRQALGAELQATVFQTLDDETWERLEGTLIYADVGAATTPKIVERLQTGARAARKDRRAARARGRLGRPRQRRRPDAPAARAARRVGADRRGQDRPPP